MVMGASTVGSRSSLATSCRRTAPVAVLVSAVVQRGTGMLAVPTGGERSHVKPRPSGSNSPSPSLRRWRAALLPLALLILFFLLEVGIRAVSFPGQVGDSLALRWALREAQVAVARSRSRRLRERRQMPTALEMYTGLFAPEGRRLLRRLRSEYRAHFRRLAAAVAEDGALLALLYVPPGNRSELGRRGDADEREFYRALAEESGASFLDASERLNPEPLHYITMLPDDIHLSRYGHHLVAQTVLPFLRQHLDPRASPSLPGRPPRLLADLRPSRSLWGRDHLPYHVSINRAGFRSLREVESPRATDRLRVLLLGDSITFGWGVHDEFCYSEVLARSEKRIEVLNAAVNGYTIDHETDLYQERARFAAPDVVVLQVYYNDVFGFLSHKREEDRRWPHGASMWPPAPSYVEGLRPLEDELIEWLRASSPADADRE